MIFLLKSVHLLVKITLYPGLIDISKNDVYI
jgi:hypothetical protein